MKVDFIRLGLGHKEFAMRSAFLTAIGLFALALASCDRGAGKKDNDLKKPEAELNETKKAGKSEEEKIRDPLIGRWELVDSSDTSRRPGPNNVSKEVIEFARDGTFKSETFDGVNGKAAGGKVVLCEYVIDTTTKSIKLQENDRERKIRTVVEAEQLTIFTDSDTVVSSEKGKDKSGPFIKRIDKYRRAK